MKTWKMTSSNEFSLVKDVLWKFIVQNQSPVAGSCTIELKTRYVSFTSHSILLSNIYGTVSIMLFFGTQFISLENRIKRDTDALAAFGLYGEPTDATLATQVENLSLIA